MSGQRNAVFVIEMMKDWRGCDSTTSMEKCSGGVDRQCSVRYELSAFARPDEEIQELEDKGNSCRSVGGRLRLEGGLKDCRGSVERMKNELQ